MSKAKKIKKIVESVINESTNVEVIYSTDKILFNFESRSEADKGMKILKSAGEFTGGYYSRTSGNTGILIEPSSTQFLAAHLPYYVGKLKDTGFNVGDPSKAKGPLF